MAEQQTCGQGLAEHSALPAKLAEVTEAIADTLQVHMKALDLDDDAARQEHSVYLRLAEEHRQAGARLRAIGKEMAAARDLPMGRHDQEAMSSPEVAGALRRVVDVEQELLALVEAILEQDRQILAGMGAAAPAPASPSDT